MRPLFYRSGVPAASGSIAKKALQLSLIAAPALFFAAPSQAGTRLITSNGFAGAFASSAWTGANNNSSAVFTPTTLTLTKAATNVGQSTKQASLTAAQLTAIGVPTWGAFVKSTVTYDWNFTFTGANNNYRWNQVTPYSPIAGNPNSVSPQPFILLNPSGTTTGATGSVTSVISTQGDTFGFQLARAGGVSSGTAGSATAVVSNFKVVTEYEVPGPLPLAGAVAAFAWSRKLRNRLKLSESIG